MFELCIRLFIFLSFRMHNTWMVWHILTGLWFSYYSASFLTVFSTLLSTILQTITQMNIWTRQHNTVNVYQVWIWLFKNQISFSWPISYVCLFVCVSLRHKVRQEKRKRWKPSKPEGVIGLSAWIFDWRKIKNSVKGNSKNKRGKTSHDRSRQTGKAREDGKKAGKNNGRHFNDYSGF